MTRSPGMSQALARSPGLLVSTVLTCMVGALLPPSRLGTSLRRFWGVMGVMSVAYATPDLWWRGNIVVLLPNLGGPCP